MSWRFDTEEEEEEGGGSDRRWIRGVDRDGVRDNTTSLDHFLFIISNRNVDLQRVYTLINEYKVDICYVYKCRCAADWARRVAVSSGPPRAGRYAAAALCR